jgi:mannose/fructose/N-acetylgalactosamine-specific phosphotransferase system component IIC
VSFPSLNSSAAAEMLPDPLVYLVLVLFGGWMAVDGTSCGQFMLSRPFVAATVAGAIAGDATAGALLGVVLEAFHLAILPVGAAKYPEAGPAAVVGGAALAAAGPSAGGLVTVVLFVLAAEWVGSESIRYLRRATISWTSVRSAAVAGPVDLERRHLGAMAIDFLRGAALVAIGVAVISLLLPAVATVWGLPAAVAAMLRVVLVVGLLASSARLFAGRARLFLLGAAGGLLFLLIRG